MAEGCQHFDEWLETIRGRDVNNSIGLSLTVLCDDAVWGGWKLDKPKKLQEVTASWVCQYKQRPTSSLDSGGTGANKRTPQQRTSRLPSPWRQHSSTMARF